MSKKAIGKAWSHLTIAVVGGDEREQEIARLAATSGATVKAYGFPWPHAGIQGVEKAATAADAFHNSDFALFPIPGIDARGALFAPACDEAIIPGKELLATMRPGGHIILGWADERLKAACDSLSISLHEYEWDEDLMLLRGPAIIEGVLKVLIENTQITIHRAHVGVVGQGTIGFLLTRYLVALGAKVRVFARNPVQRAAAVAANADAHPLTALGDEIRDLDIVLSTVPAPVVGPDVLEKAKPNVLLVDLAAPPGGIDFHYANAHQLRSIWARGLGRRAPITVGQSQWGGIETRIRHILADKS